MLANMQAQRRYLVPAPVIGPWPLRPAGRWWRVVWRQTLEYSKSVPRSNRLIRNQVTTTAFFSTAFSWLTPGQRGRLPVGALAPPLLRRDASLFYSPARATGSAQHRAVIGRRSEQTVASHRFACRGRKHGVTLCKRFRHLAATIHYAPRAASWQCSSVASPGHRVQAVVIDEQRGISRSQPCVCLAKRLTSGLSRSSTPETPASTQWYNQLGARSRVASDMACKIRRRGPEPLQLVKAAERRITGSRQHHPSPARANVATASRNLRHVTPMQRSSGWERL